MADTLAINGLYNTASMWALWQADAVTLNHDFLLISQVRLRTGTVVSDLAITTGNDFLFKMFDILSFHRNICVSTCRTTC